MVASELSRRFGKGAIGIAGNNGLDWVVLQLACVLGGLCAVPMQQQLPRDTVRKIIIEAQLKVVACNTSAADTFEQLAIDSQVQLMLLLDSKAIPFSPGCLHP